MVLAIMGALIDSGWISDQMDDVPIIQQLKNSLFSIWLKALVALIGAPFSIVFVAVFACKARCQICKSKRNAESLGHNFSFGSISQWPWAEVIDKGMFLGVVIISVQVQCNTVIVIDILC